MTEKLSCRTISLDYLSTRKATEMNVAMAVSTYPSLQEAV
jgi:hypothetical protein